MPISASEHRDIVKAIASGDADKAGKAMYEHVMESKVRTIENDLRRQSRAAQPVNEDAYAAAPAKDKPKRGGR